MDHGGSMQNYIKIMFLILSVMTTSLVHAEEKKGRFFIEPEVGYGFSGSLNVVDSTAQDTFSGVNVGGRLGANLGKFLMIGGSMKYLPSMSYVPNGSTAL